MKPVSPFRIIKSVLICSLLFSACCTVLFAAGEDEIVTGELAMAPMDKWSKRQYPIKVEGNPAFEVKWRPFFLGTDVSRRFIIEVNCADREMPINVSVGEGVTLFAAEPTPASGEVRRYYFDTVAGSRGTTEVTLAGSKGKCVVPLTLWDYEGLRAYKEVRGAILPRRYPLKGQFQFQKEAHVGTGSAVVGGKPAKPYISGARGLTGYRELLAPDLPSDLIWDRLVPDSSMPRYVHTPIKECPFDGKNAFKRDAYYPWLVHSPMTPEGDNLWSPYVGKKLLTNDIENGDMWSGERADDGYNGYDQDGARIMLRRYLRYHQTGLADRFAGWAKTNYERTGDEQYLHICLVAMSRMALEYGYLAAMPHHRQTVRRYTHRSLLDVTPDARKNYGFRMMGISESGAFQRLASIYNGIFPHIEKDEKIVAFLKSKGMPVNNHRDVKRFIEENMFLVGLQAIIDGSMVTNYPGTDQTFISIARALNYKTTRFADYLYDRGVVENLIYRGYYRDGMKGESMSGYNVASMTKVKTFSDFLNSVLDAHPELFPADEYPRLAQDPQLLATMKTHMKLMTTETTKPQFGDGGQMWTFNGLDESKQPNFYGDERLSSFAWVYDMFPDKDLAWAIANSPWRKPPAGKTQQHYKDIVGDYAPSWVGRRSDLIPGFGFSIIRGGEGSERRAVCARYGKGGIGHAHDNTMSITLDAFSSPIIRSWGYPKQWHDFFRSWMTNNTGRHFPLAPEGHPASEYEKKSYDKACYQIGQSNFLGDSENVSMSDISSRLTYDTRGPKALDFDPDRTRYEELPATQRRINLLVDVDDENFYFLDLYRMTGGDVHWRTMNTLDGPLETAGLSMVKQDGGSLAGVDVPYGDTEWQQEQGRRAGWFTYFYDVERGHGADQWSATWHINDSDGLKIRKTVLQDDAGEVILCTSKDPTGSYEMERRFVMTRHEGETGAYDTKSQVFSVFDGWRSSPVIRSIAALDVTAPEDPDGFAPVACLVTLEDRVDVIVVSADPSSTKKVTVAGVGELSLHGRAGLVSLSPAGEVLKMHLFEGTELTLNERTLRGQDAIRAKITDMSSKHWAIALDVLHSAPEELKGKTVYVKRGGTKIGYEIIQALNEQGCTILRLNYNPVRHHGVVDEVMDYKVTDLAVAPGAIAKSHHGARIVNLETNTDYILESSYGGLSAYHISPKQSPDARIENLQQQFPAGSKFEIQDYGIGDEVIIPLSFSL